MLNNLKNKETNHSVTSLGDQVFIRTTPTHKYFMRNLHTLVKNPPPGNVFFQKYGKSDHAAQCDK